jgi:hypothetical protein
MHAIKSSSAISHARMEYLPTFQRLPLPPGVDVISNTTALFFQHTAPAAYVLAHKWTYRAVIHNWSATSWYQVQQIFISNCIITAGMVLTTQPWKRLLS